MKCLRGKMRSNSWTHQALDRMIFVFVFDLDQEQYFVFYDHNLSKRKKEYNMYMDGQINRATFWQEVDYCPYCVYVLEIEIIRSFVTIYLQNKTSAW